MSGNQYQVAIEWLKEYLPKNARKIGISREISADEYIIRAAFDVPGHKNELVIIAWASSIDDQEIIKAVSQSIINEYEAVKAGKEVMTAKVVCT